MRVTHMGAEPYTMRLGFDPTYGPSGTDIETRRYDDGTEAMRLRPGRGRLRAGWSALVTLRPVTA